MLIRKKYSGFPWASLVPGALIVDVGGGVGGAMMSLFKVFPHLRFAVQDTTKMVEIGYQVESSSSICTRTYQLEQVWNRQFPNAIASGQVMLQGQCCSLLL